MAGLFIIAHAPLASSLKSVAAHAFPEAAAAIEVLDVEADMPIEQIEARAREALARARRPEALVLADVFGATPCNVAQRLAGAEEASQVKVIAGVNVPMLWRALAYANEPLDALAARAVAGATQGVMSVAVSRPQNQAIKPGAHAPEDHHHQQ